MYISLDIASRNDLISQLLLPCSRVKLLLISAGNFPKIIGMRREPYVSCDCPSDSKPRILASIWSKNDLRLIYVTNGHGNSSRFCMNALIIMCCCPKRSLSKQMACS
jgi:hypothetical protein